MQDNIAISDKDKIIMKLLHYFITDQGYNPVILHGIKDEIWLENLNSEYKIIRIVSNYIHNNEQLNLDIFRTKRVLKSIKKKTLSLNMDTLSIFIDLGDNVKLDEVENMDLISIEQEKDLKTSELLLNKFPGIMEKLEYDIDGMDLFIKLTGDINKNREKENTKVEDLFKERKPILMPIIIILNLIIFLLSKTINNNFINTLFFHENIYYLIISMFGIYLLGSKVEGFYGITKTTIIYMFSVVIGTLMAFMFDSNAGYIAATFGLAGALINFGSYYRVYLTNVLKLVIIPVLMINIIFALISQMNYLIIIGIMGGLAGFLISRALGVKYKENKFDIVNSTIMSIILLASLIIINFM